MAKQVADWMMEPIPGYECRAVFFNDGTAEFFDEPARHRENDRQSRLRKLAFMLFEEDDRHLADEVCRYTHPFKVPPDLLEALISANHGIVISEDGEVLSDITKQEEIEINAKLNAIFWRDINRLLTTPLQRTI